MRTRLVIAFLTVVSVLGAVTGQTEAQGFRQYAAKFVCGRTTGTESAAFIAAPGSYFTVINVHNPALSAAIEFRKKFAVGLPAEKAGRVSEFFPASLKADEAMLIECRDIYSHLKVPVGTFLEGWVVLVSPERELDVVGVYTAAPAGGGVSTLHMERVPVRLTQ
ncbi:MAG: hypothetical protein ACREKH_16230 [Candidatus Rokuibacteriota bacterium]